LANCAVFKVRREALERSEDRAGLSKLNSMQAGLRRRTARALEATSKFGRRFGTRPEQSSLRGPSPADRGEPRPVALGLPRKEVIQPHLPVRLPCYDFTPIAGPTFDGSLPCGLGHRLRVLLTFVV
jgi:hypothetical protein